MGIELVAQLISLVAPIAIEEFKKLRAEKGTDPTTEEVQAAILQRTVSEVLAKGQAWRDAHPR